MNKKIVTIEEILGVPKGFKRSVPGTFEDQESQYLYIEDDGTKDFYKQFDFVSSKTLRPQAGTLFQQRCKIFLPDGKLFHAVSYSGDFEGWRLSIEDSAKNRHLLLGWIEGEKIVISDGSSHLLSECKVEFY